ncbi:MAG: hypothetical protein AAFV51_10395 [Pseudomonadota bacterium]
MISLLYLRQHLLGVWRMARGAEGWEKDLDLSEDGVFRAFSVAMLILPLLALSTAASRTVPIEVEFDDQLSALWLGMPLPLAIAIEAGQTAVLWVIDLAILAGVLKASGLTERAAPTVVSYWFVQLFSTLAMTAAVILTAPAINADPEAGAAVAILGVVAIALNLFLLWGFARRGVGLPVGPSIGLIAMFAFASVGVAILATVLFSVIVG